MALKPICNHPNFLTFIVIGGWGNTRTLISKNNQVLAKVHEYNILDESKPVKVILEITKSMHLLINLILCKIDLFVFSKFIQRIDDYFQMAKFEYLPNTTSRNRS